jgi:hypothetical protein
MNAEHEEIARIKTARAIGGTKLKVRFVGERAARPVNLTGLLSRSRHFAPLLKDEAAFSAVEIIESGLGLEWPIETEWGRLDVSAATLLRIADEQQPMSGAEFAEWRKGLGLSLIESANLLGLGRRTVMGYLKRDELPPVVAIACRALARDKHLLAAHYVPSRKPRATS